MISSLHTRNTKDEIRLEGKGHVILLAVTATGHESRNERAHIAATRFGLASSALIQYPAPRCSYKICGVAHNQGHREIIPETLEIHGMLNK